MRGLGPPLTPEESAMFVAEARSYIGVRWKHQGRDRRGIDCGGLIAVCMRAVGRPVVEPIGYGRLPYRGALEATLRDNYGDPVSGGEIRFGDSALFNIGNRAPNHTGIIGNYIHGGLSLIHAYAVNREVVESPLDDVWLGKLVEFYR